VELEGRTAFLIEWTQQLREDATVLCQRSVKAIVYARLARQAAQDGRVRSVEDRTRLRARRLRSRV
jgi:hypothetical protein